MVNEKETTTLIPPVGAGGGQPSQICTDDSITVRNSDFNTNLQDSEEYMRECLRRMRCMNDPAYLPTITMQELYETVYRSKPPIIDGLLYPGTYLFAGAPKVGKSFLVAQLAYHISTGQKLWEYDVHQGTVLYLALEDNYQRLQERMYRMFGVEGTDKFHFAVFAKQIGNGLDEQLERFVKEHPDTKLMIIDTLQKVREMGGEAYSYADDYQIVGRLKQFADKAGVCLLLVHHTRKTPSGDKFEMISGTTGLLGCADGAFVLQKENRTDNCAMLDIVGRDQPDQRIYLVRDEKRLIWNFDHTEKALWKEPPDTVLEAVASLLSQQTVWQGSATDLLAVLGLEIPPNALTKRLNIKAGTLRNEYRIGYENEHSRNGSSITLTVLPPEA